MWKQRMGATLLKKKYKHRPSWVTKKVLSGNRLQPYDWNMTAFVDIPPASVTCA